MAVRNNSFIDPEEQGSGEKREKYYPLAVRDDRSQKSRRRDTTEGTPVGMFIWRILKPILACLIGLSIVGFAIIEVGKKGYEALFSPADEHSRAVVEVTIKSGSSLTSISEQLEEAGVIRNAKAFKYYVDFSDMSSKLVAGDFKLSPNMSFDDIINVLKHPTEVYTTQLVTFREGDTLEDYAELLVKQGLLRSKEKFLSLCRSGELAEKYFFYTDTEERVGETGKHPKYMLEGFLFPDTYDIYTTATEEDIINKLIAQFNSIYNESFIARAEELGMSTAEVVTMASLVEKESKTADFAKVAAVFHNRLKENMKLQSDASLQYIKHERKLIWTEQELSEDSPYNTHLYEGLPAGPICCPSLKAITAVLYPEEGLQKEGFLYFCLGDPTTGDIVFAKTLKEHEKNVEQYRPMWEEYQRTGKVTKPPEDETTEDKKN